MTFEKQYFAAIYSVEQNCVSNSIFGSTYAYIIVQNEYTQQHSDKKIHTEKSIRVE